MFHVKIYKVETMSDFQSEAATEEEALADAQAAHKAGRLKFYAPDCQHVSLVSKPAPPKRSRGSRARPDGETLEGGQGDGS